MFRNKVATPQGINLVGRQVSSLRSDVLHPDNARCLVFVDENALMIHDPDPSGDEDRFILLGLSASIRLLLVCHCYRENDDVIRIISARKATRTEQKRYWER